MTEVTGRHSFIHEVKVDNNTVVEESYISHTDSGRKICQL